VWEIPIEIVTPLYGSGPQTRQVDDQTPVRPSSIRGQLRFWWRALYGGSYGTAKALYRRERELFGGLSKEAKEVEASRVVVEIQKLVRAKVTDEDISQNDLASYALWPARETQTERPTERWKPGIRFVLTLRLTKGRSSATDDERELIHTLRAWLLFGGIGGRTRRGCGAIGVPDEAARNTWLPESGEIGTIGAWLSAGQAANQVYPSLTGSRLCLGLPKQATNAWHESVGWLRDFRQGANPRKDTAPSGSFARQRPYVDGRDGKRSGRSRWPEPDQIRCEYAAFDHMPLASQGPTSWPRAQFGLPIQFQFQDKEREKLGGGLYSSPPPPSGELVWSPEGKSDNPSQRLASPLILKPAQLRDGSFVGIALWLQRTLPGEAIAGIREENATSLRAVAPMGAMPDSPLFTPLSGKASTRDAFMDWLNKRMGLRGGSL
jgi:CRISPR-associated protein Cmr1